MTPRLIHPSIEKALANARVFHVRLFLGVGAYARADAATLEAAREAARRLEGEHLDNFGRTASIYCETISGLTVHIE